MAPLANISTPVLAGPMPVANFGEGIAFLFYPLIMHAVMYIATNGELRVTSPCVSYNRTRVDIRMVKICNQTASGDRLCLYSSGDGSHFLATSQESGRLLTVRNASARALLNSTHTDDCLWFQEVESENRTMRVIGCPATRRYTIVFGRLRFPRNSGCGVSSQQLFSQSVSTNSGRKRRRSTVGSISEAFAHAKVCPQRAHSVWHRCHGQMQASYHLNWSNCL